MRVELSIPVGTSPAEMAYYVRELKRQVEKYLTQRKLDAATVGRMSPDLIPALEALHPTYKNSFLKMNSHSYPVVVFPVQKDQRENPNDVLGELDKHTAVHVDPFFGKAGDHYVDYLKSTGSPLNNIATFCYDRFTQNGTLKVDCSMGNYFDSLRSCFVLEWELTTQLGLWKNPQKDFGEFTQRLKLRNHVIRNAANQDPVADPSGRRPAIGIQTLVLFNRGSEKAILLGERSSKGVIAEENYLALVPAGIFQPIANDLDDEFSVIHNIYREYLEELFSMQEVTRPKSVMSYDYFYTNPDLLYLTKMLDAGTAKIYVTGFAMNMLSLRLDICTLLYISSDDWYNKHKTGTKTLGRIEFNEEWKSPEEKTTEGTNVWSLNRVNNNELNPTNTLPTAAGALSLGLAVAAD
jgi:hypothetical protein